MGSNPVTGADKPMVSERGRALILAAAVLDRPNADPDDDMAVLARQLNRAHEAAETMRAALLEIRNHWANQYDHPRNEMYAGSYGIGVTDGHRACAIIARRALGEKVD